MTEGRTLQCSVLRAGRTLQFKGKTFAQRQSVRKRARGAHILEGALWRLRGGRDPGVSLAGGLQSLPKGLMLVGMGEEMGVPRCKGEM